MDPRYKHGGYESREAYERMKASAQKGTRQVEFFSEDRANLMREVNYHPKLVELMEINRSEGKTDWFDDLAEIATYCGVVMDGSYLPAELEVIYKQLYQQLREERSPIIVVHK